MVTGTPTAHSHPFYNQFFSRTGVCLASVDILGVGQVRELNRGHWKNLKKLFYKPPEHVARIKADYDVLRELGRDWVNFTTGARWETYSLNRFVYLVWVFQRKLFFGIVPVYGYEYGISKISVFNFCIAEVSTREVGIFKGGAKPGADG